MGKVSPFLLIKEFERLKKEAQKHLEWSAKRELSKINYRIHTDAIKNRLIPIKLTKDQINIIYAEEDCEKEYNLIAQYIL